VYYWVAYLPYLLPRKGGAVSGIKVENAADLVLVLLHAPGSEECEPVDGITRLQKLMFLLQQEDSPAALVRDYERLEYRAFKLGPYSDRLTSVIDELVSAGIISAERLRYWLHDDSDSNEGIGMDASEIRSPIESLRFRVAPGIGKQAAEDLWRSLSRKTQKEIRDFKRFFNSLSLRQLLIYTYRRYPEFTEKSIIKDKLGLEAEAF
jgi:hypothetical protein